MIKSRLISALSKIGGRKWAERVVAAEAAVLAAAVAAEAMAAALAQAASAAADAEKTHFIAKNRTSQEVLFFQLSMFLPRKAATVWASLHSVSPARRP